MMVERGIDASYEMLSRWVDKFGLTIVTLIHCFKGIIRVSLQMSAFAAKTDLSIRAILIVARCSKSFQLSVSLGDFGS